MLNQEKGLGKPLTGSMDSLHRRLSCLEVNEGRL